VSTNGISSYASASVGTQLSQTITFPAMGPVTYSNGLTVGLGATSSSGLAVIYGTASTNMIGLNGTNLTVLGAGTATVVAYQAGNSNYAAATPVTNTLMIAAANPTTSQSIPLNAGCTWVSFNVGTTDGTWTGLLSGDRASDNDVILGSGGVLTYQSGTWYPSDPSFRPSVGAMYMVNSATVRSMSAAGMAPGATTPVALVAGWNWVGSPGTNNTTLETMIPALQVSDGDVIVNQMGGMATFYQGKWYSNTGAAFAIRPGLGYQLFIHTPQNQLLH
jgi:hypothetical protein